MQQVPFWWDYTKESLAATIRKYRPDIILDFAESSSPIPDKLPQFQAFKYQGRSM